MDEKDNGSSVSSRKLEANRHNAQLSTGPRTQAGKNHSRRNALKHGVLASVLLVTKGGGAEDAAEFKKLLCDLNRDLAPVGRLEEMLVEKIAVCWWRQKRALRYEALMIRQASGEKCPELCHALEESFSLIRERLQSEKSFKEADEIIERARLRDGEPEAPKLEVAKQERTSIAEMLGFLEPDDYVLTSRIKDATYHFGLPADAEMNRILRYETSIQRQMVQAINQLERVQRARKAEQVPPPLDFEVLNNEEVVI